MSTSATFAMPAAGAGDHDDDGLRAADIPKLKVWSEAWVLPFRGRLSEEEEIYAGEQGVEFQHHIHATIAGQARAAPTTR